MHYCTFLVVCGIDRRTKEFENNNDWFLSGFLYSCPLYIILFYDQLTIINYNIFFNCTVANFLEQNIKISINCECTIIVLYHTKRP